MSYFREPAQDSKLIARQEVEELLDPPSDQSEDGADDDGSQGTTVLRPEV